MDKGVPRTSLLVKEPLHVQAGVGGDVLNVEIRALAEMGSSVGLRDENKVVRFGNKCL